VMRTLLSAALVPTEYGTGGMYQHTAKSGLMAAGLAAASPVYSFCWQSPTLLALVRRIRLSAWSVGAFTAGIGTFDLWLARAFTVADSGGAAIDLSGNHAKLRTSMASSSAAIRCATTAALVAGTRVLDPDPVDSLNVAVPATASAVLAQNVVLFAKA